VAIEIADIALWINRIAGEVADLQQRVYGAAMLETAMTQGMPKQMPVAYVVMASEHAANNEFDTGLMQQVTVAFSVITAIRNAVDVTGMNSHQMLRDLRQSIMTAILNWTPDSQQYDITQFVQGQLLHFENAVLWWEDVFSTRIYLSV
jgi:hypothetical protein